MTVLGEPSRQRRGRRRRRVWPRVLAALLGLLVVFALGVALGKALNDAPESGVTVTSVRTLEPIPQETAP